MPDVVGTIRREKPRLRRGRLAYAAAPFRVLRAETRFAPGRSRPEFVAVIAALDGSRERTKRYADVLRCPVFPAEHARWKAAAGYAVEGVTP